MARRASAKRICGRHLSLIAAHLVSPAGVYLALREDSAAVLFGAWPLRSRSSCSDGTSPLGFWPTRAPTYQPPKWIAALLDKQLEAQILIAEFLEKALAPKPPTQVAPLALRALVEHDLHASYHSSYQSARAGSGRVLLRHEKARLSGPSPNGRCRARTSDPLLVRQVLSQLS